jgi:UDP-N-acetylglucosamine 3-dehydrogenase
MSAELRVGVIGAGRMGGFHVDTWERIGCARLVAVADPDETRARRCIAGRDIAWHGDWRELVAREDIDAVTIAAPSDLHAAIATAAMLAGRHVLVEKPVAARLEDALRMAGLARSTGRKLMVGHVERFNPAVGKVRELVAAGRIGRVYRLHATRVGPLPERIRDAGVAIDLATHDLDIMQHVLGLDVTHVYAEGGRWLHPSQEDMLTCLLRVGGDGPHGLLDVNWLTPERRRELTVVGEGGMLQARYITQDVWFTQAAVSAAVHFELEHVEPLRAELEAFARCVLDDTPEPVSVYDGCRALLASLAVRDSAAASRQITLLGMPAAPTVHPAAVLAA